MMGVASVFCKKGGAGKTRMGTDPRDRERGMRAHSRRGRGGADEPCLREDGLGGRLAPSGGEARRVFPTQHCERLSSVQKQQQACSFLSYSSSRRAAFFPAVRHGSFIVLLNRKVAALIPRSSDAMRISAQLLACTPFYFAGPVLLTICAALQILFSAYHSAASEFLLISFCLPFVFTSPWWGSWWYLCYVPAAVGVPVAQLLWKEMKRSISPTWQKWSFEKGTRANVVTLVNNIWRSAEAFVQGAGTSFPFLNYIRRFLHKSFLRFLI